MDVKEAARVANKYVKDLFVNEDIVHVGLEEVVYDESTGTWNVTIGFFRSWDIIQNVGDFLKGKSFDSPEWKKRSYKVVKIDDETGQVKSLTHRAFPAIER